MELTKNQAMSLGVSGSGDNIYYYHGTSKSHSSFTFRSYRL